MSIKILINAGGMNVQAWLKDEALPKLIQLTQDFRDEQQASTTTEGDTSDKAKGGTAVAEQEVSDKLKAYGAAELLNSIKWDSYPEKIILLAAWHEAHGGNKPWRSADMDEVFKQAKEKAPANFPRDIRQAIKSGCVHAITPRTYEITRTGWNKIAQALAG